MLLPIYKNVLWLVRNIIDHPLRLFSIFLFNLSLAVRLDAAEPHFSWNIMTLISMLDFFLLRLSSFWQRWDISSHPTARSLFQLKDICCCCRGKFQKKKVPLNTHSLLGINQTLCSSGWVLRFAPVWVMMVDIVPSGSHCSGLAGAADVWLRLLEKYGC